MKNIRRVVIILLVFILIVCFIGIKFLTFNRENTSIDDIKKISVQNTFAQKEDEYIVYYWQATCSYCKQIEKDVLRFSNNAKIPIYIVDMQDSLNTSRWYDWEAHHKKYDKVIGKIEAGKEVLNAGVNIDDYKNSKDVSWSFEATKDKKMIARHNTPYGNKTPANADVIEITGTPTMIHVKNGKFAEYAVGVDETVKLMQGNK
ncbi:hypothetical protein [Niallia sp. 01092]|uniref:hypothetical protein n=1 Tax=unclassified Niallia TaxID=2837522 RepID=UPI003FD2FE75